MKRIIVLIMMAFVLMLAACGESKSVSDVLSESIETNKGFQSYSTEMKIETEVMGMKTTIDAKGDITHNPDTMYMEMKMAMPGIAMDIESYIEDGQVYMGMLGQWFMMDDEDLGLYGFDQLNEDELDKLNGFIDLFEMKEESNKYVLTLVGEGEEFEDLLAPYLEASMDDLELDFSFTEDLLTDIKINDYNMEMSIDKKSMQILE